MNNKHKNRFTNREPKKEDHLTTDYAEREVPSRKQRDESLEEVPKWEKKTTRKEDFPKS